MVKLVLIFNILHGLYVVCILSQTVFFLKELLLYILTYTVLYVLTYFKSNSVEASHGSGHIKAS